MKDFENRAGAALVTGGSGGLGAIIAETLAARGARVAVTYRSNQAAAEKVASSIRGDGGEATTAEIDLADDTTCVPRLRDLADELGGFHTVVYASGPHVPMVHLSKVEPGRFREQVEQDVLAAFNLVHATLPTLRESKGSLIAVTTAATVRYATRDGLSAIPKAAVETLMRAVAAEEGRFGIRANCVGPGMVTDGMAERLIASGDLDETALEAAKRNTPLRRFGDGHDIAEIVAFLASDRAGFVSGQKLDADGGYAV